MKYFLIRRLSEGLRPPLIGAGLLAAAVAGALPGAAQGQPTKPRKGGTIQEAEIEIVKDRVNELGTATRNFDKIKVPAPPKASRAAAYTFPDFRLPPDRLAPSVRVLTIRQEELTPLNGNLLKAGIGNYGTFYGRAYLHSTRSTDYSYGLDFKHINSLTGPVDGRNSAVSQTSAALTGEIYRGTAALGGALDVGRERYNFYGYTGPATSPLPTPTPEAGALKQVFRRFGLRAYARNQAPAAPLQYEVGVGYKYWKDDFTASESNVLLNAKLGYALGATSRFVLAGDASFITDKDSLTRSRNFVQVTPAYELKQGPLALSLGVTLGYSSDTTNNVSRGAVYPALRATYAVVPEQFTVYGGLGGGIQRVTRYELSTENPWLNRALNVADSRRGYTLYAGFASTPARGLELNGRITAGRDRNLYFYANDPVHQDKFNLVYDREVTTNVNVHGEALYGKGEKFRLGARADYNYYGTHTLVQPFGRPEFQATIFGTYSVSDKVQLGVETYFYSASYGISYVSGVPDYFRATDPIYDLNLRADYRITSNLSIFAMGNNLANRQYQRFYRYPVKGINVLGGLTYTF